MKAAVGHLEQFMEKADTAARGKVMLATVKGDVHDIGKNLVEIILANNGYTVVNLGIKVPPDQLIQAFHEHHPDAIGLSGLLVKSTQQMVITATDLKMAGIAVPLLVGGAALSEKFTRTKIAPAYDQAVCYAKDAMTGLSLMNRLMDPDQRANVLAANQASEAPAPVAVTAELLPPVTTRRKRQSPASTPFRFPPRLISSENSARFRTSPRYGVTSIPSCSTAAIWVTRVTSKRRLPSTSRKPLSYII